MFSPSAAVVVVMREKEVCIWGVCWLILNFIKTNFEEEFFNLEQARLDCTRRRSLNHQGWALSARCILCRLTHSSTLTGCCECIMMTNFGPCTVTRRVGIKDYPWWLWSISIVSGQQPTNCQTCVFLSNTKLTYAESQPLTLFRSYGNNWAYFMHSSDKLLPNWEQKKTKSLQTTATWSEGQVRTAQILETFLIN